VKAVYLGEGWRNWDLSFFAIAVIIWRRGGDESLWYGV